MTTYYAFSKPESNLEDLFPRKGTVSTINPFVSIFITTSYNIRVRDLTNAFNKTENFLIFSSESAAIEYFNEHLNFAGTSTLSYETPPLFKVEVKEEIQLNKEGYAQIDRDKLVPIAGKLLWLDHNYVVNKNAPYVELSAGPDTIVHASKFTHF